MTENPAIPPPTMDFLRSHSKALLTTLGLAALGALVCLWLVPQEIRAVDRQLVGFPDSDAITHRARPWVLAFLAFLPALASAVYLASGTLSRYIVRQFLVIFGICMAALFLIWLLMDLSDNVSDFRDSGKALRTALHFYGTTAPATVLLLLPYGLLLALLYSLGKLSSHREIVAMIQSGRGVIRITIPLLIAGVFCTLASLALNYHWAPVAEGQQKAILDEARGRSVNEATEVLYRNAGERRLWMIGAFPRSYEKGEPLQFIEITTTDDRNRMVSRFTASRATWDRETSRWTFIDPVIGRYGPDRAPVFESPPGPLTVDGWTETPWQLIKPGLSAAVLGIPDLNTWLLANRRSSYFADPAPYLTHWHYRWALPFTCVVTVLLAAPLAIHFSRRAPAGSIFIAVVLSAVMMLFSSISLALGEAGITHPMFAAWLPNGVFALLGLYLFHRRITGRPIYQTFRRLIPGAP